MGRVPALANGGSSRCAQLGHLAAQAGQRRLGARQPLCRARMLRCRCLQRRLQPITWSTANLSAITCQMKWHILPLFKTKLAAKPRRDGSSCGRTSSVVLATTVHLAPINPAVFTGAAHLRVGQALPGLRERMRPRARMPRSDSQLLQRRRRAAQSARQHANGGRKDGRELRVPRRKQRQRDCQVLALRPRTAPESQLMGFMVCDIQPK